MNPNIDMLRRKNDALRFELLSAVQRLEYRVTASEELFEARARFREEFRERTFSAEIEPELGVVEVTGDGRLAIRLDHAKVVASDISRLGDRILAALTRADRELHQTYTDHLPKGLG
jgi:DNA-binding protein YbaB